MDRETRLRAADAIVLEVGLLKFGGFRIEAGAGKFR